MKANKSYSQEYRHNYYLSIKGRLVELNRIAKRRAKRKNIEFNISTNFLCNLWDKQNGLCAITGLPLIIPTETNNGKANPYSPSIDRINSRLSYTPENVRLI